MNKIITTNPGNNYHVVGEVMTSTEGEVKQAFRKARKAQPKWTGLSQVERNKAMESFVKIIQEHTEEIAVTITREMGKPIVKSRDQVTEAIDYFHAYMAMAEEALRPQVVYEDKTQRHTLTREPLGVIVCITPWNFPILNLPWQAGQALLAGNTVLFKPSKEIILFAKLIEKLIVRSELPDGVFTVIFGDSRVGEQLVQLPPDAILFTGSALTGQRITELASKNSTRVLTEMGGSAPGIVFQDANIPAIIQTLYMMRFDNTGQYCDGLKRLIVHESKFTEVLTTLKNVNSMKKTGDPMNESTDFGPLANKQQLDILRSQMEDALTKGAKVVFGGKEPIGLLGAFYEPTVLTNITFDMRVWREEIFGPVLPVVTFNTEAEAIHLANDTTYGLGAFIFTADKEKYRRVAKQIQSGIIAHNNALYFSPSSPFGGYKASGNSRTGGMEGFHEVTQIKLISEEK